MNWSYRIISHAGDDSDVMHDIREVHVDADGKMVGVSGTAFAPVHFASWSDDVRASLIWQLERALDAVRTAPIVPMPTAPQSEEGSATEGLSGDVPGLAAGRMPIVLPLCTGLDGEIFDAAGRCFLQVDPKRELGDDQVDAIGRMIVDRVNDGRYERLVRRIAEWTEGEIAVVCPRQTRHVAQVVVAGADPVSPSFAPEDASAREDQYLVWSNEHKAWWGANHRGYTRFIDRAGRYDRTEALRIARTRDGGWRLNKGNPDEIAIRERDAIDQYADISAAQASLLNKALTATIDPQGGGEA